MHTVMATSRGWWKSLFILPWLSFFAKKIFSELFRRSSKKKNKTNKTYLLSGAVPESGDVENICLKMAATLSRVIKGTLRNRAVTVQQNDEKISCIPDLARPFFVTLPSSFLSPSCCVSSHCARSSGDDVRPPCFEPLLHKYSRGLDGVLTHIREDLLQMQPVKSFIVYIFQAKIKTRSGLSLKWIYRSSCDLNKICKMKQLTTTLNNEIVTHNHS